jgi:hypothetical protein
LYGFKTWSLAPRDESVLRVFQNRVLRKIFGLKGDGVRGGCRRIHKEILQELYSSSNKIRVIKSRRMKWAGNVARMRERRGAYSVLAVKSEGKRPLGRPRYIWKDNIK